MATGGRVCQAGFDNLTGYSELREKLCSEAELRHLHQAATRVTSRQIRRRFFIMAR